MADAGKPDLFDRFMRAVARVYVAARPRTQKRGGVDLLQSMMLTGGRHNAIDMNDPLVALQTVAVWATHDLIRSLVSEMPFDVIDAKGKKLAEPPDHFGDPDGDGYGWEDWTSRALSDWLISGNLLLQSREFGRSGVWTGVPTAVDILSGVSGRMENGRPRWMVDGHDLPADRVRHVRMYPRPGQVLGLSPISYHMTTVAATVAANRYGLDFFQDSAIPAGIIRNNEVEIDGPKGRTIKARWMEALQGVREPVVMGRGWEYQQIQVKPEESQFLATMRFGAKECCSLYGPGTAELLGYGDTQAMTYANIVDRRSDWLTLSGDKWVRRIERVGAIMLPPGWKVRLNRNSLLRATALDRFKAYALALGSKWTVPNEVRAWEDMDSVPWGNEPVQVTAGSGKGEEA